MKTYICYCFEHTAEDIHKDVQLNEGRSAILEQIVEMKKTGGCQCASKHPEGR